jgi:glycine betaine/choline ABC-type transport system substrate-binding protein
MHPFCQPTLPHNLAVPASLFLLMCGVALLTVPLAATAAEPLAVATISGLARLPPATLNRLRTGLPHAFLVRAGGQVDLIDVYSTDAQIGRLGLCVLRDDRGFFPRCDAVLLMRQSLPEAAQRALAQLQGLSTRPR